MQNSVISSRNTSLQGPQTSPVVLCMQNNVISIRITNLYGSQVSFVVFACKTATLGTELQVSLVPRPHLWFLAFKTEPLAPELQVSMDLSPHLWFLHAKQRLLDQNYKSLWLPHLTCRFVRENSVISTRITSLHRSRTSPVVLCMQNNVISFRKTSLYASQPSSVVFACKTATLGPELQVSMDPSPHLWFLHSKQRLSDQNYKSLWVPDLTCHIVHSE